MLSQFQQALLLYSRGPGTAQQPATVQPIIPTIDSLPQQLDDLLKDPRAPNVQRYLRRIYIDPMTGKAEWGVVRRQGRIIGVYSLSADAPLGKKYELTGVNFEAATKYSDWQVVVIPTQQGGGLTGAPPGTVVVPGTQPGPAPEPSLADAPQPETPAPVPEPVVRPPPPRERPTTTDRDLTVMNDRELNQYCTQLNLLDVQACSSSKSLTPLGKTECMKSASARQGACMLRQNTLPPLYLSSS